MMFLSIYIRVLPHTGQKVNEYRCNVSQSYSTCTCTIGKAVSYMTLHDNIYKKMLELNILPTDSKLAEYHCLLLGIWDNSDQNGSRLQDLSQSQYKKETDGNHSLL